MGRLLLSACFLAVVALRQIHGSTSFTKNIDPYFPHGFTEPPLDFMDKLYKTLDILECKVKTAREQLEVLEAQVGMMKRTLRELILIVLEELERIDDQQHQTFTNLFGDVDRVNGTVEHLCECLENVTEVNNNNIGKLVTVRTLLTQVLVQDIFLNSRLASVESRVGNFKEKLLQVCGNSFWLLGAEITDLSMHLDNVRQCESKRICESGTVTLDYNDKRAEYLFQNKFYSIPQVWHGISSYNFLLDTRPVPPLSGPGHERWVEPNVLGIHVSAVASRTGVTFTKINQSFGDTRSAKITVSFEACSIGAGRVIIHE